MPFIIETVLTDTIQASLARPVLYAIGDVHGEAARLQLLHDIIVERHGLLYPDRPARLIHLGDYVDRGADSAGVIDILISAQNEMGANCICLRGNHEAMMLDGLTSHLDSTLQNWLRNGGEETMTSYHNRQQDRVPKAHISWLSSLPNIHVEAQDKLIFVHAGINPNEYPNEREDVYLWTRARRFFEVAKWDNPELEGWTVVHGHTPTDDFYPEDQSAGGRRINIDTGAVFGGRLTAAVLDPGETVRFLYA